MKPYLLALLYCISSPASIAQTNAPTEKTLLWRISGKGLSQPSYLYGTMHLADERLFNFSDSLLIAIEKSDGFAIEVDPDEMMTVVMEETFNDIKETKLLKDVVSRSAYDKYAPLLSKRLKKPEEELTVKDVLQEQNKWMHEAYSKGSMPTFVDIWLYDIARRQGKWVGGIEDVEDQNGLSEDLFNEQDLEFLTVDYSQYGKKFLKNMIDTYEKQDIEGIDVLSSDGDSHRKDVMLLRRNVKMTRRMDSLSALRTMVFAVGAAHLPGDSGVISLLRQKGFDVQPVFSSKKIAGKNYKVDTKVLPWQKIADTKGLYEVEMPGKANPMKMYGLLEMRININLFTSSGYLTMAFPSSLQMENPDSVLLVLARKMMQDERLKQGKAVSRNGINGREYISKTKGLFKRGQVFSSGQTVYLAFAFFNKGESITGPDATRFFESLVLYQRKDTAVNWGSYSGLLPGLEGTAPVIFEPNMVMSNQAKEEGFDTRVFTGMDSKMSSLYMLISKNTGVDLYIPNDSSYLSLIGENARKQAKELTIDSLQIENGVYTLEQKGIYKDQDLLFHSKTFIKGNRSYSLFVITPKGKDNEEIATRAVQSFKITSPPATQWTTQALLKQHFTTWAPGEFLLSEKNTSLSSTVGSEAWNSRDLKSRPH